MNEAPIDTPASAAARPRVALFITCMVDTLRPEVGIAAVELLEQNGVDVVFPDGQTCCGQPAFNAGYRVEARKVARHFLDVFYPLIEHGDVDAIVAPSGSCTSMVRNFYRVLFDNAEDDGVRHKAEQVSRATYELTEYLVDVLGVETVASSCSGRLAYHACCHLLRELGVDAQPRRLLASLGGAEIVDLPGADECCGFGGLFAVKNPDLSVAMGRRKIENFLASSAGALVMNDLSCMTHLNGILQRDGHACRAIHIAEVLTEEDGGQEKNERVPDVR
jgi:L-lactate dehydrogenase complex protein LldE